MIQFLKKHCIFLFGIFIFLGLDILYIRSAGVNTVWDVALSDVKLIDKFFTNTLAFQDVWASYAEHRLLGFKLLFLLSARFFHLNNFYALYLVAGTFIFVAFALYLSYKKIFSEFVNNHITQLLFVPIIFVVFTLVQMSGLLAATGMTTQFALSTLFAVTAFLLMDEVVKKFRLSLLGLLILNIFVLVLLFGGGYSAGFYLSIVVVLIVRGFTEERLDLKIILPILASLLVAYIVYIFPFGSLWGRGSDVGQIMQIIRGDLSATLQYFVLLGSVSLIGQSANGYGILTSIMPYMIIGGILFLLYGYAIWVFFSSKMQRHTFMPLFLFLYAFGSMIAVWLGRSSVPSNAFNPWYIPFTKFAQVAMLWVFLYSAVKNKTLKNNIVAIFAVIFIVGGQLFGNYAEMKTAHFRKYTMEYPIKLALAGKENVTASIGEVGAQYTHFIADFDSTMQALDLLEKYDLSFYHDVQKVDRASWHGLQNVSLQDGWYKEEIRGDGAPYRWIGKIAIASAYSGENGKFSLQGFVPTFNGDIEIKIFINDQVLFAERKVEGLFQIESSVPKNQMLNITIQTDKSTVLAEKQIGRDERDLSIIIYSLSME